MVAGYFVALAVWGIAGRLSSPAEGVVSTLRLGALGVAAIALLVLFAWLVARTTLYTITTRRVIIRFGIALPITIQIPFRMIGAAGVHVWADGTGDIALSLLADQRIAYLVMWPHTRPWKLAKAQPSLRAISDAASVATTLGRALAASASQSAKAVSIPVPATAGAGNPVPAAA